MVSKKDLNKADLEVVKISNFFKTLVVVKSDVLAKQVTSQNVREPLLFVTVCFLKMHRQFFHSENSTTITSILFIGHVI